MKKFAFKRITAMVLIFVMCTFLMADNSLGVKAVTADDVLVEDTQVTSEISAENPASEVEVITSEESEDVSSDEDLNAEELASDEGVDEVSGETEDVEPLEILYENGATVLADDATELFNLTYGTTTETNFTSFDSVCERIDELDNADGVYTITCTKAGKHSNGNFAVIGDFPTKAKELILVMEDEDSYAHFTNSKALETDIKLTIKSPMSIYLGCDLNEVIIDGGTFDVVLEPNCTATIDTLTVTNRGALSITRGTLDVNTFNVGKDNWIYLSCIYMQDGTVVGEGLFDFETINLSGNVMAMYANEEAYHIGDTVLKTTTALSQSDLYFYNDKFSSEVVNNQDGTYSVVLTEKKEANYTLSYESGTQEFESYDEVVARIDALNSPETEYTITLGTTYADSLEYGYNVGSLPAVAKKITFVKPEAAKEMGINFSEVNADYQIEFSGWEEVTLRNCDLGDVTFLDAASFEVRYASSVDKLTIGTATELLVRDAFEIEELVYITKSSANSKITIDYLWITSGAGDLYGTIKIDKITLATSTQKITLDIRGASVEASPIFELETVGDVWDNITVTTAYLDSNGGVEEGYSLKDRNTVTGGRAYVWEEDGAAEYKLQYGNIVEYFTNIESAIARINDINNANNDYTITMTDAGDLGEYPNWNGYIEDFPEVAKSLKITKSCQTDVTFNLRDADGIVTYPLTFEKVHLYFECDLQTQDLTLKDCGLIYVWNELNVDGTFSVNNSQIIAYEPITAQTLSFNVKGTNLTDITLQKGMVTDNLKIPSNQTVKVGLYNSEDSVFTVNNESADLNRVKIVSQDQDYEGAKKVDDDGHHIFYTKKIEPYYYVTDMYGDTVINTRSWLDVHSTINSLGQTWGVYTIKVADGATIGTLPTKASLIILQGDDSVENPIIKCPSSISATTTVRVENAKLEYSGKPVNVTLNGKTLILDDATNIGKITGGNGYVYIYNHAEVNGIQTLKSLTVYEGATLYVNGAVSAIAKLDMYGELQVEGSNAVTVTEVENHGNARITYLGENINQNITINGTLSGNNLALVRMESSEENGEEVLTRTNFPVGTKLLTAAKITADRFVLDGDGMIGYKTGNVVYAGKEALELYNDDTYIGTYAKWSDIITQINESKDADAVYTIKILEDFNICGALTLPKDGTCTLLNIDGVDEIRTLYYTGDISVPSYAVAFGSLLNLQALTTAGVETTSTLKTATSQSSVSFYNESYDFKAISGKGTVYVKEDVGMKVTGTVTAHGIVVSEDAMVQAGGATTVNGILLYNDSSYVALGALKTEGIHYVSGTAQLVCRNTLTVTDSIVIAQDATTPFLDTMNGKAVSIKNLDLSNADADVKLHMFVLDANGIAIAPANGQVIITTTGNLYTSQIALYDENIQVIPLYRTGNNIKVQGAVETPYHVTLETEAGVEDLGNYATLTDVQTEIGRRNAKTGIYTVTVEEASFSNGAFPMPKAGTFDKIIFEGESITFTGALALTGDTEFRNELIKVKSATDSTVVEIDINIGKYMFIVGENHKLPVFKSVTGSAGSVLEIAENAELEVTGKITGVGTLDLDGVLKAWGDITVTDIHSDDEGTLHYQLDKKLTINGTVTFDRMDYQAVSKIHLYPYSNNELNSSYADEAVIIDVCAKADVSDFAVSGLNEGKTLYRASTAVKVGTPKIVVFEKYSGYWQTEDASKGKPFVTINDAIDHINEESYGLYIIRLEEDIPSAGTIKTIKSVASKSVVIDTKGGVPFDLNFSGTLIVDGCGVEIRNVELCNSASANASVLLKPYATLTLCNTTINALTTESQTKVYIENDENVEVDVVINGTVKCNGEFIIKDSATFWCKSAVTTKDFTLDGQSAEMRILTGKAFTINGNVNVNEDCSLCINVVDKDGNITTIKEGTTIVTAINGKANQFATQNIMAGTDDMPWLLTKSGKVIKTARLVAYVYEQAEVTANDKYYPFASFNEAKEFVQNADQYTPYYIELVSDSTGADLTDLPENLISIRVHEDATKEQIKLTANTDMELSREFYLEDVIIVASGKTLYADGYLLDLNNSDITAGRADRIDGLYIVNGTATFTSKTGNTINFVTVYDNGCLQCPAFSGF